MDGDILDDFEPVTSRKKCPICDKDDWCLIPREDSYWSKKALAICQRDDNGVKWGDAGHMHFREPSTTESRVESPVIARKNLKAAIQVSLSGIRRKYPHAREAGRWAYHDDRGRLYLVKVRFDTGETDKTTGKAKKEFRPFRKHGKGWAAGDPNGPLPLWRLPLLKDCSTVYVTEGEKAASALVAQGIPATTWHNPKPDKTDWSPLLGKTVVFLPDNDEKGDSHVDKAVKHLMEIGATDVRVAKLPDLPDKGDADDFVEQVRSRPGRRGKRGIRTIVKRTLSELTNSTPRVDPDKHRNQLKVTCMADVRPEPVKWLWQNRIALGKVTLFAGNPGVGKSFLTVEIASIISTRRKWPDDAAKEHPPMEALLFCSEDDASDTIRPRLDAHKARALRIHHVEGTTIHTKDGVIDREVQLLNDIDILDRFLAGHPRIGLVVIDPMNDYMGKADTHKDTEVRSVLRPLGQLARKHNVAVLAVCHLSKGGKNASQNPLQRVLGSIGYVGAARAAWLVTEDPEDPDLRLMLCMKNNVGPDSGNTLAFRIQHGKRLVWEDEPPDVTATEVFEKNSSRPKLAAACKWLHDQLKDGPVWSESLFKLASKDGHKEVTMRRAIKAAKDVLNKKSDFKGGWYCCLEGDDRVPEK